MQASHLAASRQSGRGLLAAGPHNGKPWMERHMTRKECQAWTQTGLGLAPFCGHQMDSYTGIGGCVVTKELGRGNPHAL